MRLDLGGEFRYPGDEPQNLGAPRGPALGPIGSAHRRDAQSGPTLHLVTGLAAAAFAEGSETWRAWAPTFLPGLFLDRADGELVRLCGKTSPRSHNYDWSAVRLLTRLRS